MDQDGPDYRNGIYYRTSKTPHHISVIICLNLVNNNVDLQNKHNSVYLNFIQKDVFAGLFAYSAVTVLLRRNVF